MLPKALITLAFVLVLGVPWLFRPESATPPAGAERVVIITPNNEQIRYEFGLGFDRWHREKYGTPAVIDWRQPGGTSDIRRQLIAQYTAAVQTGRLTPDGTLRAGAEPMPYDVFWAGGSFEHNETKKGVKARPPGSDKEVTIPMSAPMDFSQAQLDEWFGENKVGSGQLYDAEQYWLGTALSGFGIVFNRDVLRELGLPDPVSWKDLCDPRLIGWVALADPRQSGSVATTYDSILNAYGWDEGWRTLRLMSANARYFAATSPKPPIDVTQGLAAAGVAIDFYGRYQAQSVMKPGETPETSRVGYIDPPGAVLIDADPVSILRAGPRPDMARRFVEFTMTEEAQALWQFPVPPTVPALRHGRWVDGEEAPTAQSSSRWHRNVHRNVPPTVAGFDATVGALDGGPNPLGPEKFELRRMPVRRAMYEKHAARMIDRIDPFAAASDAPLRGWRSSIGLMMGAFGIDTHEEQQRAWKAICEARGQGVPEATIAEAVRLFFAWPVHTIPARGGKAEQRLEFSEQSYNAIRADWREAEKDGRMARIKIAYTNFFRRSYEQVVELLEDHKASHR